MKVVEALNVLSAHEGEADVASVATANPPFWKGLVLAGLSVLRTLVHMDGDQSAAWDTVVALIEAL